MAVVNPIFKREGTDEEWHNLRPAFSRGELVLAIAICLVAGVVLYPALQSVRNPAGPHGDIVPVTAPEESNRITHPTGLSIIAPPNWDQVRDMGPSTPFLSIAARGTPGRRLRSVITVSVAEPPPEEPSLQLLATTQFQGQPAYEQMRVLRRDTFDDPALSSYDLYVERERVWWRINFLIADEMTELPPEIHRYISTVVFP